MGLTACAQSRDGGGEGIRQSTAGDPVDRFRPHAGMVRYADVSGTQIVFVYANDLWIVPRTGGLASPMASPPGAESFPRFSANGDTIAFVGNYDGNRDLYTIPTAGGIATRVTHHPADETLCDWTADGSLLFFSNGWAGLARQVQLFRVSANGGLPQQLPVPYGANGAISADGTWLAYTPHTADQRTWKRYRGGMATDVWLFNLVDHSSNKMTDWEGTDTQPMWHGQRVYYLSDGGPEHRLNIWSYEPASGRREQVTHMEAYDVKWPAIGPGPDGLGEIVFQNGPALKLLDLSSGEVREVSIEIPGDRPAIRAKRVDASKEVQAWAVSNSGKRGVFEARGDIWTVPVKDGSARNLTRTVGVAERDPAWSPDGQWIAHFSDETGEYELYVMQSDGKGGKRQLTTDGAAYRYDTTWSPDSKRIAFTDKSGAIFLHDVDAGQTRLIDTEPWSSRTRLNWSSDSDWLAYVKGDVNQLGRIWLYHVADQQTHAVTSSMFDSGWPTFDRKGDYLYYVSRRDFSTPIYEDIGTSFVYAGTSVLLAVPLRAELGSPWAPKSDEEKWGDEKEKDDEEKEDAGSKSETDGKENGDKDNKDKADDGEKSGGEAADGDGDGDDDKKKEPPKPVVIELEGFERRAIEVPVDRGNLTNLAVNDKGQLLYVRAAANGSEEKSSVKLLDPTDEEKKEKTVVEEADGFVITADGKKILVKKDDTYAIVDAGADQKLDKPMSLSEMSAQVDPREEWRQLFVETWRIQRDFFYDPNMHGVDWAAIRDQYAAMLADCASREDVTYVIGEMISEINVGHAYAREGGDLEEEPKVSVGMLGADFELDQGAYRITRIHEGAPWDVDARGPLSQPGVNVQRGDYLLAVNHAPVDPQKDPWAAFLGLAGKTVTITVHDKPAMDDSARHVIIKLLDSERELRYRDWVERNRAYVEAKTDGAVGYIYVPNTGTDGQNELFRQFYGQVGRKALIIDERWNGGGQIPTRFIELLNRPATNYWARRDGRDWTWPPDAQQGPKCMLINGLAGSGGDCFPYYFRQAGIGKLIGTRTWGGLVGISGNPTLIDGGRVTAPTFAFYETDGTWGVEGHGVAPDIEVIDDPAKMMDGADPQLDAAIEHLLQRLREARHVQPPRPSYPNRRGMGIAEQDK